jgi:hypothetical protein
MLFGVVKSDIYKRLTCGRLLRHDADVSGEEELEGIRAAMRVVDSGTAASFTARNMLANGEFHDVSVVVLPITIEFVGSNCNFLVGFQKDSSNHQEHFDAISSLYSMQLSPAREMLKKWMKAELIDFLRMQSVFTECITLMSPGRPSLKDSTSRSTRTATAADNTGGSQSSRSTLLSEATRTSRLPSRWANARNNSPDDDSALMQTDVLLRHLYASQLYGREAASVVGCTLQGDSWDSLCSPADSLDSILERGRLVAGAAGEFDLEEYRLKLWWEREGAGAFVQAQAPHQRHRAQRCWLERYTAEQARIRVELARHCISSVCVRQQFKEEIFGLYYLCRSGSHTDGSSFYPSYSAANTILDFLGEETCPEIRGPRSGNYKTNGFVRDNIHPSIQIRFGVGTLRTDVIAGWELDSSENSLGSNSGQDKSGSGSDEGGSSSNSDSLTRVRQQGRRSVEKLLLGRGAGEVGVPKPVYEPLASHSWGA